MISNDIMRKIFFFAALFSAFVFSCKKDEGKVDEHDAIELRRNKSALEVYEYVKETKRVKEKAFDDFMGSLSLSEKVSQLFIINLDGKKDFRIIEELDGMPFVPGGYLFFAYNIAETAGEVRAFTSGIKNYCEENDVIPPFLAIDEEGGSVQRLRKIAGKLPSEKDVANTYNIEETYDLYSAHAVKMANLGFHLNLAPVVEILSESNRDFLEERSFGDERKTTDYSIAAVRAYQEHGIGCVVKHFPGNTNTDPHKWLPEIEMTYAEMEKSLRPFRSVIQQKPAGVLMSHAKTKLSGEDVFRMYSNDEAEARGIGGLFEIDGDEPSCFSKKWITGVLRGEFGFDGIVFSDDIFMGALANNGYPPDVAAVKAIEAGVDCIMSSGVRFLQPARVLIEKAEKDPEFEKRIDESCRRIIRYKMERGILIIDN